MSAGPAAPSPGQKGPLAELLARRIAANGPITLAEYMADALGHPEHGYYRSRDPLGAAGDFTTAPEISQMFGEMIGLWAAIAWQQMGSPDPVRLVELGPGRGTLMADFLRAAKGAAGFLPAIDLHLVETSRPLRERQRRALLPSGIEARWHEDIGSVPDGPMLLVANEFFDALPIRQLQRLPDGWHERLVDRSEGQAEFRVVVSPGRSTGSALLHPRVRDTAPIGAIAEICPAGLGIMDAIGRRLASQSGAALIIDYGAAQSAPGDSFQAVKAHRFHDPLADPGAADLTAHVDFEALSTAARQAGAVPHGPIPQGAFLTGLGIEARAEMLRKAGASDVDTSLRRLLDAAEMGNLFKVLALTAPAAPTPAGFEA
ncbi:MAG: SAM-dependent methyltransferase [Alphaproteobacteria bacterium]|nr:SAM-dependent methyltransferase [Alphaproteobacteria bacterium]MBU0797394.1 SAM-dependent methyltransferase [Alphaproteobacteria bacterium]MBU0888090.1 SAM-dependent methyltransferase [Alphaproteobacteria bacterium]MBU1811535.1 SAM-dependent methyltransferase [Alphaproteobacteria bacterium]